MSSRFTTWKIHINSMLAEHFWDDNGARWTQNITCYRTFFSSFSISLHCLHSNSLPIFWISLRFLLLLLFSIHYSFSFTFFFVFFFHFYSLFVCLIKNNIYTRNEVFACSLSSLLVFSVRFSSIIEILDECTVMFGKTNVKQILDRKIIISVGTITKINSYKWTKWALPVTLYYMNYVLELKTCWMLQTMMGYSLRSTHLLFRLWE